MYFTIFIEIIPPSWTENGDALQNWIGALKLLIASSIPSQKGGNFKKILIRIRFKINYMSYVSDVYLIESVLQLCYLDLEIG